MRAHGALGRESDEASRAQDQWWLSGIHRDVHIYSKPAAARIRDYAVCAAVDPLPLVAGAAGAEGDVALSVTVHLDGDAAGWDPDLQLRVSLHGPHILQAPAGGGGDGDDARMSEIPEAAAAEAAVEVREAEAAGEGRWVGACTVRLGRARLYAGLCLAVVAADEDARDDAVEVL